MRKTPLPKLIDALINVRRNLICAYDRGVPENEPDTCDCKYGLQVDVSRKAYRGEMNGCPELREIELLLSYLTPAEWRKLCNRIEVDQKRIRGYHKRLQQLRKKM